MKWRVYRRFDVGEMLVWIFSHDARKQRSSNNT
jgi:hypothetical protein